MEFNPKVALQNFEATVKESAADLIRSIDDTNLPKSVHNEVLAEMDTFTATMIELLKTYVGPRVDVGKESIFKDCITIVESSWRDIAAQRKSVADAEQAQK